MPVEGSKVTTKQGEGVVKDINILKQTVVVDLGEGRTVNLPVKELIGELKKNFRKKDKSPSGPKETQA